MKYVRVIAAFCLVMYVSYLSDRLYVVQLKPIFNDLTGWASVGYALLTWLPRFVLGFALGRNTLRLSNWIWNRDDKFFS